MKYFLALISALISGAIVKGLTSNSFISGWCGCLVYNEVKTIYEKRYETE